jgi:hypothetical protein
VSGSGGNGGTTTGTGGAATGGASGTGGAGQGGSAGSGGGAGQSGDAGDAGDGGPDVSVDTRPDTTVTCADPGLGSVTFRIKSPNGTPYCTDRCRIFATSIAPADGGADLVIRPNPCFNRCDFCAPGICPTDAACPFPEPLNPEGHTYTWYGDFYRATTCGAQPISCNDRICAAPGQYVVTMCAAKQLTEGGTDARAACSPDSMLTCVEVPFEYPTMSMVDVELP